MEVRAQSDIVDCQNDDSLSTASQSTITKNVQKNKGDISFLTDDQAKALFVQNDPVNCPIATYQVVKPDGSLVTSADTELYAVLKLASRTTPGISMDSNIADPTQFLRKFYNFGIKATSVGGLVAIQQFQIELGCFEDVTSMTGTFLAPAAITTVSKPAGISSLFRIQLVSSTQLSDKTYNLEDLLSFNTNFATCYSSKITLCSSSACTAELNGGPISIPQNPKTWDTAGFVKTTLTVVRTGNFIQIFYFKGENYNGSITDKIAVEVVVCITDNIVLSGDGSIIKKTKSKDQGAQYLLLENEVKSLFSITDELYCPIDQIQLVKTTDNSVITSADAELYEFLNIATRTGNSIQIQTNLDPNLVLFKTFQFGIKTITKANNFAIQKIEITVGCYSVTTMTPTFTPNALEPSVQAPTDDSLFRILNVDENPLGPKIYELEKVLQWTTNQNNCYAQKVMLCSDATCTAEMASGGNVELSIANPTLADANGFTKPRLSIKRDNSFGTTVYFKGFNYDDTVTSIAKVSIQSCVTDKVNLLTTPVKIIEKLVNKDQGIVVLFDFAYIQSLFVPQDIVSCPLKGYRVSKQDGSYYTSSDDEYTRFKIGERTNLNSDFMINSDIVDPTVELLKVYNIAIQVETEGGFKIEQPFKVKVGCFTNVNTLVAKYSGDRQGGNIINPNYQGSYFKIELLSIQPQVTRQFNLWEILVLTSNIPYCGVSKLALCQTPSCDDLVTTGTTLLTTNPTVEDAKGFVHPVLNVDRSVSYNKIVYVKGYNFNDEISKVYLFEVYVCADDRISTVEDEGKVIQYNIDRDRGIQILLNVDQIKALFVIPDIVNCPIIAMELNHADGSSIGAGSEVYARFRLNSRGTWAVDLDTGIVGNEYLRRNWMLLIGYYV